MPPPTATLSISGANRFILNFLGLLVSGWMLALPLASSALDDFTVIVLPDTQNYSNEYPPIYPAQTQWITNNWTARNMKFVSHVGDVVDNHSEIRQWNNSDVAMRILDDAGRPYGIAYGNHDIWYAHADGFPESDFNATNYRAYYGPQRFAGKSWYGGASPNGQSNYQIIDVGGGFKILFLHLAIETPPDQLSWAQGILNQNRDKPVMVSLHRYIQDATDYTAGVPVVPSGRYPEIWYTFEDLYRPDGIKSEVFFNGFVKANRNIFLVHCGHFHGEHRQTDTNNAGLPVHGVLADYQDDPNGGNGYLRIMQFRPSQNRIDVQSYSPTLNAYKTGGDSQFSLSTNLDSYVLPAGSTVLTFQNGVGGYNGTEDTFIYSDSANSSYGNDQLIVVDNDWRNNIFSDYPTRGLLKFGGILGSTNVYEGDPAPSVIPPNAVVQSATLRFHILDDVDIGGEDLILHRMNIDWNEGSTWNSLGGGIGGSESSQLATISGDNNPDGNSARQVDVTSSVQLWKGGSGNYGFAFFPENINGIDDGMDLASSENNSAGLRPALDVQFTYTVLNRTPNVTPLAASRTTVNEGESIALTMAATDPNPNDPVTLKINGSNAGFGVGTASCSVPAQFPNEGSFVFTGQVLDDEGTVSGGSVTVTVNNVAPIITFLSGNLSIDAGQSFNFTVTATDPGATDILTYNWDLDNDGDYDDHTGASGSRVLNTAGIYPIKVRVADNGGGATVGNFTVTVNALTGYAAFAQQHGIGSPLDDNNHNGFVNFLEYAFAGNPNGATPDEFGPEADTIEDGGQRKACITFRMLDGPTDAEYIVEASDSVAPGATWTQVWSSTQGLDHPAVVSVIDNGAWLRVCVKDIQPLTGQPRFLHVRVRVR